MINYLFVRIMTVLIPQLSFSVTDTIAYIAGSAIYYSRNWRVKTIRENLRRAGIETPVKMTFVNMTVNLFDFLRFYYTKRAYLSRITLNKYPISLIDKHMMIVTGHFGNWELAGLYITYLGKKMITVAESEGPGERMYQFYSNMRSAENMIVLKLEDKTTPFKIDHYLKNGYSGVLLADRDISRSGVDVDFNSYTARVPKGPYYFAKRYSLPLYLGTMYRYHDKKYRYKCYIENIPKTDNMRVDAQRTIEKFIEHIKTAPNEWFAYDMNWEDR
ncbi:MAG: lysophospholipid acyltransferase family protein [candidate division WOR-3 bacterium]|nr:lysophospholipid acyltransferase family protein [candidate division WOR-3 bacterium]